MHKYTREFEIENGKPANIPPRRKGHEYHLDDVVELVNRPAPPRPVRTRRQVPGVTVPLEGETLADLNEFREAYGLNPLKPR